MIHYYQKLKFATDPPLAALGINLRIQRENIKGNIPSIGRSKKDRDIGDSRGILVGTRREMVERGCRMERARIGDERVA